MLLDQSLSRAGLVLKTPLDNLLAMWYSRRIFNIIPQIIAYTIYLSIYTQVSKNILGLGMGTRDRRDDTWAIRNLSADIKVTSRPLYNSELSCLI